MREVVWVDFFFFFFFFFNSLDVFFLFHRLFLNTELKIFLLLYCLKQPVKEKESI